MGYSEKNYFSSWNLNIVFTAQKVVFGLTWPPAPCPSYFYNTQSIWFQRSTQGLQLCENLKTGGNVDFWIYLFWVNTTSKLPADVQRCPLNQIENGFQIRDQHGRIDRGR